MNDSLKLFFDLGPLAKEPPRQNTVYMRVLNQRIDPDLAIDRGWRTLREELQIEDESESEVDEDESEDESEPDEDTLAEAMDDRAPTTKPGEPVMRPSAEVEIVLATWDLSRRIALDLATPREAKLSLQGKEPKTVKAPSAERLEEAVERLVLLMKRPVSLHEIIFEAAGFDLAFPLLGEIWRANTLRVMDVVTNVVSVPVHVIKNHLDVKRPSELDCRVVPLIPVPGHASFPGGHAAATYALATVLGRLMNADEAQRRALGRIARRISKNRERAGLHTRLDTRAGRRLGRLMGNWMVDVAQEDEFKHQPWSLLFARAAAEWKSA